MTSELTNAGSIPERPPDDLALSRRLLRRFSGAAVPLLVIAAVMLTLEFVVRVFSVPTYILPPPSQIIIEAFARWQFYLRHTAVTAWEAVVGFVVGNVGAYIVAIILVTFPRLRSGGMALAILVKATPVVCLAPIFIIWFGNELAGKYLMAGLVCFFPMLVNSLAGLQAVEGDVVEYVRSLAPGRFDILIYLRIPASVPYVVAAAKMSSTISVVGAIVAELSGSDAGIGHLLLRSIYSLETLVMFAGIAWIAAFTLVFYAILSASETYLRRRRYT